MRLQTFAVAFVNFTAAATANTNRARCKASIFQKYIDANGTQARVQWATHIPQNGSFNPMNFPSVSEYPTNLPEGCGVQINVKSEGNSSYLVGLIMPYEWNGRLLSAASGRGINWVDMGTGTNYGFATLSSNLGHVGINTAGTWAIDRPQAVIDWGYRAWHDATGLGKLFIEEWYGSAAEYSYFYGCSTGGRQSMKNMQEYPDDYDGILAGAPAWWTTHQQLYNLKQTTYQAPANSSHTIPEKVFDILATEVLKQCDPQDGLVDTIISNPKGCNPNTLMCNSTSTADECLTDAQLNTLYKIYNDWVDVNQTYVYGHMWLGSEASWLLGNIGLGEDSTIDQQLCTVELANKLNPGNATADKYDISAFQKRGGKFLHYHGLVLKLQGIEVDDFYRMFFLIPGMDVPGYRDAKHDIILAMMSWVENGTAPDSIIATKWKNDTTATNVLRQRPICHYPYQAKYDGKGDPDEASN
ncbi:tannase and feruloyl esterase [Penicillium malachiteum]|uniref:tannase and feruloyl esterase n=1 Tax=Penicillium malachiteum TaxID=1324776 RepID=UPI0025481E77|nr:tannase and feruloyl esterase [Penicillium malachiteum]KAJ5737199.1 tannase and feruloyl esterase [Penicillium malachiteum]